MPSDEGYCRQHFRHASRCDIVRSCLITWARKYASAAGHYTATHRYKISSPPATPAAKFQQRSTQAARITDYRRRRRCTADDDDAFQARTRHRNADDYGLLRQLSRVSVATSQISARALGLLLSRPFSHAALARHADARFLIMPATGAFASRRFIAFLRGA